MGISVAEEAYIVLLFLHACSSAQKGLHHCTLGNPQAGGLSEIPEGKRKEHFTGAESYLWIMQKYLFKINIYWSVAPRSGRSAQKSRQHE